MEFEELKSMWEKYDSKLDNLEKMNKILILETLLSKPRVKLKWIKFKSIYMLIGTPVLSCLFIFIVGHFLLENIDIMFIIGSILVFSVTVYFSYLQIKSYLKLKQINIGADSIIESATKISKFKLQYNARWKHAVIYYPIMYVGTLLIIWEPLNFSTKTIVFLTVVFIITYIVNIKGPKIYRDRMERLEKEIINLKEYID